MQSALQGQSHLSRSGPGSVSRNSLYHLVASEILNQGVARLHIVELTTRVATFENRPQLHELMAGTSRIKGVERHHVFLRTEARRGVAREKRDDLPVVTASGGLHVKPDQTAGLMNGIDLFHDCFQ